MSGQGFSAAEVITIISAIGGLIVVVGGVVVNVVVALKTGRKIDDVKASTTTIEGHVNGAATVARLKEESSQAAIAQLTTLLAEARQSAALIAQRSTGGVRERRVEGEK